MIFCVEDDGSIRDVEVYALKSAGFDVQGFENGEDFLRALETQRPQLVLLDVMLPGVDGLELLKKLKGSTSLCSIPVVMATAKGAEYDKVQSLDMGADYYLVKPFGVMELVSCVKAVLRRCAPTGRTLALSGIVMNVDERTVEADGVRVSLTYKEFEILRTMLENPGVVFTRQRLFSEVWGDDYFGESRTVDMHIRTLRQKLGRCGDAVQTVRSVGYKLEGER